MSYDNGKHYDAIGKKSDDEANRYTVKYLNYSALFFLIIWIGIIFLNPRADKPVLTSALLISAAFMTAPNLICLFDGTQKFWIKYVILFCAEAAVTVICTFFPFHIGLLIIFPLVFSVHYGERRVVLYSCFLAMAGLCVSTVCGYFAGNTLTADALTDTALNPLVALLMYIVVPRGIVLLIFIPPFVKSSESMPKAFNLRKMSEIDCNTQFYNRNKYEHMLSNYYPSVETVGVIFWDINNLKLVNDTYGHHFGDIIISDVAQCIHVLSGAGRSTYRIGGDEFVMILENHTENEVLQLVKKFRRALKERNSTSEVYISVAVGYSFGYGVDIRSLVDTADKNMYRDKRNIKNANK